MNKYAPPIPIFPEPAPTTDLFICTGCGFQTVNINDCEMDTDGDWETGYFEYPCCPRSECGCVMERSYTKARLKDWKKWYLRKLDYQKIFTLLVIYKQHT